MMGRNKTKEVVAATASDAREQLETLKAQVERLLNDHITPSLVNAADKADHAVANAREITDYQVNNVSTRVRSQPLLAIGISSVIGYLVGRFTR